MTPDLTHVTPDTPESTWLLALQGLRDGSMLLVEGDAAGEHQGQAVHTVTLTHTHTQPDMLRFQRETHAGV